MSERILVVGGAGGIGAAVVEAFQGRSESWSRRTGFDATDPALIESRVAELLAREGPPYALVHSVSDFAERPLLETDSTLFDHLVGSNLRSAFLVARALVPAMAEAGRGRVLWFAAAGVEDPAAKLRAPVYFAAKAALVSLARSLAAEVAGRGVTVNVISPGIIRHPDSHRESQDRMAPRVPLGRSGGVGDVIGAVRYLLSDQAAYVTGAVLTIDGGLSL